MDGWCTFAADIAAQCVEKLQLISRFEAILFNPLCMENSFFAALQSLSSLHSYLLFICTGILWNFDFHQFEISSLIFFLVWTGKKIPVWNTKLAKSKIPVRVVKNVISKWTKMEFPRFPFLWFTAVGVVNPPDQKLVMYISVNCKKGINS